MVSPSDSSRILTPPTGAARSFTDADAAVAELHARYDTATEFLRAAFEQVLAAPQDALRHRAFYPALRLSVETHAMIDSRLSFGHAPGPGEYAATITRPDLFANYLRQQIDLVLRNHGVPVTVGWSETPMPLHFALAGRPVPHEGALSFPLRDYFDVPDLTTTNDDIVNGVAPPLPDGTMPLAPFTAPRVDYSLARLAHYTATDPDHFQNHVLFTNYQFYVSEFEAYARTQLNDPDSGYTAFVSTGNATITTGDQELEAVAKMPQMPTYHLKRADGSGITLVNIGVGPSNAKTATDHIAVLRPHAWLMVGHCAGLRNSQALGDFVLAHGYLREDNVLDNDLPPWVPIPALAEIQIALEEAVAQVPALGPGEVGGRLRVLEPGEDGPLGPQVQGDQRSADCEQGEVPSEPGVRRCGHLADRVGPVGDGGGPIAGRGCLGCLVFGRHGGKPSVPSGPTLLPRALELVGFGPQAGVHGGRGPELGRAGARGPAAAPGRDRGLPRRDAGRGGPRAQHDRRVPLGPSGDGALARPPGRHGLGRAHGRPPGHLARRPARRRPPDRVRYRHGRPRAEDARDARSVGGDPRRTARRATRSPGHPAIPRARPRPVAHCRPARPTHS